MASTTPQPHNRVALVTGAGSRHRPRVRERAAGRWLARGLRRPPRRRAAGGDRRRATRSATSRSARSRCPPTSPSRPGAGAVRRGARSSGGSTCCSTTPAWARRRCRSTNCRSRSGAQVVDTNLNGAFLCCAAGVPRDEGAEPQRRAHHQQRLDLGLCAAPELSLAYTATKHAVSGLTRSRLARRPRARHRGRPDRHRQRRHRDDRAHGGRRAAGRRLDARPSRAWTCSHVAEAVVHMANLPLDATCCS